MKFPVFGKLGLHPPFKAAAALNIAVHKLTFREIRFVPAIASAAPGNGAFCITRSVGQRGTSMPKRRLKSSFRRGCTLQPQLFTLPAFNSCAATAFSLPQEHRQSQRTRPALFSALHSAVNSPKTWPVRSSAMLPFAALGRGMHPQLVTVPRSSFLR